ncbi:DUF7168 domain-containing protein [Humitalea sp. 24SJ18S-53]|uniref:DUF7168 domain-containing protein n=1 Tax=Humitalea sp. 24SJ18S-53 TaxID=3422307 RepID=UPI003D67C7CA
MSELDAIKARIRALGARTTARGCTEAEALAAAEKMLELMRQHRLTDDQVACGEAEVSLGRMRRAPGDSIWLLVASACHCIAYTRRSFARPIRVVYVGRLPWPEVAEWMHGVVAGAMARANRDFLKTPGYRARRTRRTRNLARAHFAAGMAEGLAYKLAGLIGQDGAKAERAADVALARRAIVDVEFTKSRPVPVLKGAGSFAGVRNNGRTAGMNTSVNWGVNGGKPPLAIGRDRGE